MPKRRANGEGECRYDEARNRWMARLPPDNYGRKGPRKSFLTQKEALKYLKDAQAERDAGIDHSKKDVAISVLLDTWLEGKRHSLAQRTYENHQSNIKILNARIGKVKTKALTPHQIQTTFNAFLDEGRAISSVHGIKTTLKAALEKAITWGLITVNPAKDLELPPIPKMDIHAWDAQQIQAFLRVIEGHYLEMFFIIGMWLGLRRGELFNLRWSDIDLDTRLLTVRGSAQRLVGKGMVRGKTKSKSGERTIPLDDDLVSMLRLHKAAQMRSRLAKGWKDEGVVFTSTLGKILDPTSVTEAFKRLLAAAGLPLDTRIHDLRHTAISQMLANGGQIKVVSEIAGHSSVKITMDIYGHSYDENKRAAVEGVGKVMKRKVN